MTSNYPAEIPARLPTAADAGADELWLAVVRDRALGREVPLATYWRPSDQKQRWCAAAVLVLEAQFRRIKRLRQLALLARALRANAESTLPVAA